VYRDAGGFVACADLGYARFSAHGVMAPSVLSFQRLTPAQTVAAFA
jgi:hypothetical protein